MLMLKDYLWPEFKCPSGKEGIVLGIFRESILMAPFLRTNSDMLEGFKIYWVNLWNFSKFSFWTFIRCMDEAGDYGKDSYI